MWKIEFRETCKVCGGPLPNARFRTFCGKKCRDRDHNQKQVKSGYSADYQKERRLKVKHNLSTCADIKKVV